MTSVCVYCASSMGVDPLYREAAEALARELVSRNLRLVYGGASVGLMGVVARTVLNHGGHVTGVIPRLLVDREIAQSDLSQTHVVDSMHERKELMHNLADGFIAMPGGFGTLEEIFEALTWGQLKLHAKPCGFLNVAGFYDSLFQFLDNAVHAGLLRGTYRDLALCAGTPATLLDQMSALSR